MKILLLIVIVFACWTVWGAFRSTTQRVARTFPAPAVRYDFGRVLVVYYSGSGNTAEVAGRIAAMTGGELQEVETPKAYPSGPMLYFKARSDLMKSPRQVDLKTPLPDPSAYDMVFVGAPVWWYSIAAPMLSFLAQRDFAGKPVIPFCTAGGNAGNFFERFAQDAKNADVLAGMEFSHVKKTAPEKLNQEISGWLDGIRKPFGR